MKIALVCRRYHPEIGGVETHVREIAERLAKDNEVTVFTLASNKDKLVTDNINGVNVRRFKCIKLSYSMEFPPEFMIRSIEQFEPDIIHAHSIHTTVPYYASLANCGSKFIVTPHYLGGALTAFRKILFAGYKPYINKAMKTANRIICTSPIEKEMVIRDFKAANLEKIRLIPNGVDPELSNIMHDENASLRMISVARLDLTHKKTDKLVRAFKIFLESTNHDSGKRYAQGPKLVLVGNGPDKDKIIQLVNDLELQQNVEIKSNLTKKELYAEYGSASIFLLASEMENFNIAVSEALAARLKVIVPNATALAHYVRDGYAIGIDPPVTPEKLAEAITNCLQNTTRLVKEYTPYTWDSVTRELLNVYEELLLGRKQLNMKSEYNRRNV